MSFISPSCLAFQVTCSVITLREAFHLGKKLTSFQRTILDTNWNFIVCLVQLLSDQSLYSPYWHNWCPFRPPLHKPHENESSCAPLTTLAPSSGTCGEVDQRMYVRMYDTYIHPYLSPFVYYLSTFISNIWSSIISRT